MKKQMPGFVPVNFSRAGKITLTIGTVLLAVRFVANVTNWFFVSEFFAYLGGGLIFLSFYLIFVEPNE